MKTTIVTNIPPRAKVLVKEKDEVTIETPLATLILEGEVLTIDLSTYLSVSPHKVGKYLKKSIGDSIKEGDVLAEKKSLLSSIVIKSPQSGIITQIDLKTGHIAFQIREGKSQTIYPTMQGRVKTVNPQAIEIECEAKDLDVEKAGGKQVMGLLSYITGKNVTVLSNMGDVDKVIVLLEEVTLAALSKLDALGARAVISKSPIDEETDLPFAQVGAAQFKECVEHAGKEVILDPSRKKIYLLQ